MSWLAPLTGDFKGLELPARRFSRTDQLRPVIVRGTRYASLAEAAREEGVSVATMWWRAKNEKFGTRYE